MNTANFEEIEVKHNEHSHWFDFEVEYDFENDGIGSYEYWGCRGYDRGNTYPVIESIEIWYIAYSVRKRKIEFNKLSEEHQKLIDDVCYDLIENTRQSDYNEMMADKYDPCWRD